MRHFLTATGCPLYSPLKTSAKPPSPRDLSSMVTSLQLMYSYIIRCYIFINHTTAADVCGAGAAMASSQMQTLKSACYLIEPLLQR